MPSPESWIPVRTVEVPRHQPMLVAVTAFPALREVVTSHRSRSPAPLMSSPRGFPGQRRITATVGALAPAASADLVSHPAVSPRILPLPTAA